MKCVLKRNWWIYGMSDQLVGDVDLNDWKTSETAVVDFGNGRTCYAGRDEVDLIDTDKDINSARKLLEATGYEVSALSLKDLEAQSEARKLFEGVFNTLLAKVTDIKMKNSDGKECSELENVEFAKAMTNEVFKLKLKHNV